MENNQIGIFLTTQLGGNYNIELIDGSASDRKNYKVISENKKYILTQGSNKKENESFISFANFFYKKGINVPKIIGIDNNSNSYLQEHVGDFSLLDCLLEEKESNSVKNTYKEAINQLVSMQIEGKKQAKEAWCYDFTKFNFLTILFDLFYFKNYFLDLLDISYSRKNLMEDFYKFSKMLEQSSPTAFIHRDFQARNIMVKDKKPFIIDFQGGMFGPPVYDLISLIWQSRANLSIQLKEELKSHYFNRFNLTATEKFNSTDFELQYNLCLIIRQLQTLGAYGFRGIYQKKPQFKSIIFQSIKNLEAILKLNLLSEFKCLKEVVFEINRLEESKINTIIDGK